MEQSLSRMTLFVFQKTNDLYLTRSNKEQYERYLKQGLAGENIIHRYLHLPTGWLQEAKPGLMLIK
ncbi:hypothetical protein M3221_19155 [Domibacillus indicus]|uniref:hypothetical protein n=1 Tax=Domibacillus indicus TaxID=1437523 RepID=UPI00204109A0|nr:hypothetical protein [Domibacillus indicus]MCM3790487.1 hypothetical protein [Domibacillus indicus]